MSRFQIGKYIGGVWELGKCINALFSKNPNFSISPLFSISISFKFVPQNSQNVLESNCMEIKVHFDCKVLANPQVLFLQNFGQI